jgi:hypothetical protein
MEAGAIPVGAMAGVIDVHGVPGTAIGAKDGRHATVIFAAFRWRATIGRTWLRDAGGVPVCFLPLAGRSLSPTRSLVCTQTWPDSRV